MNTKESLNRIVARWSIRRPWAAVSLWLVFVIACLAVGAVTPARTATSLETGTGDSARAEAMLRDAGLTGGAVENVLITARNGPLDVKAAQAAAAAVAWRMSGLAEVAQVGVATVAENNSAVLLPVVVAGDPDTAGERLAPVQAATRAVAADFPALRVEQAGDASLTEGLAELSTEDLEVAGVVSLPVTLVILLVVFGALVAAGAPVLLGLSAVAAALGLSGLVSHLLPTTGTTSAMVLLMGMAVGVDYSLFYVKRYREERTRLRDHAGAVSIAVETSGHSVLVSGIAVMVAMLGLFLTGDTTFSSLAANSILVVAIAMLGSMTVLPALLSGLGRAMDRPRIPVLWRLTATSRTPRLWPALLRPSLRRPALTLVVSTLALLAVAAPAIGMRLSSPDLDALPRAVEEVVTLHRLTGAFPGDRSTHQVVVRADAAQATQVEQRLRSLDADATIRASADRRVHELTVTTAHSAESPQAEAQVTTLRERLPETLRGLGATAAVGGATAAGMDYAAMLNRSLPWVVAFILIATSAVIVVAFRSLVLALVTAVSNLLSAAAAFGVITLVFQTLGGGTVVSFVPLFAFAVLSGLSMDYHVFVLTRIRELVADGLPTRAAVARGITESAGTVTSAAVIMVSVFAIFVLGHGVEFKQLGVGLSTAVLIDALVIRALLLPAALTMLGHRTWWPSRPQQPGRHTIAATDRQPASAAHVY